MEIDAKVLIELLDASLSADYTRVRRLGSEVARALAAQDQEGAAKQVRALMRKKGVPLQTSGQVETLPVDVNSRLPLVEEQDWPSTPLFLAEQVSGVVKRFLEDASHVELLSKRGISAPLCLVLSGPPGSGKSLLAGHVAARLGRPFYVVRLDSLISSRLGETAKNIRNIFEFAPGRGAVLFLDEMDAVAKLRDDRHELGELKRVVNTVIQGLDSLDDESVVIGATNHPQLLDPAIWRRFTYRIDLELPDDDVRGMMWQHFLFEEDATASGKARLLEHISKGLSGADIENIALAARRQAVLGDVPISLAALTWAIVKSKSGALSLPDPKPLTTEQKKQLARLLANVDAVRKLDIAEILGVSRQMVARYLKAGADG